MKADIESQLLLLNDQPESDKLSKSQISHIEARKKFLKMILDAPWYEISEKTLNFIY